MSSALKKFVKRFNSKRRAVPPERVFVAAFGKHPGWDDHIDDIGFETDIFVTVKRILYVQGVGSNIDSGSWDKLQQNQLIEEFKHVFAWCMDRNIIVGRIWSSQDGKGRTNYPMVVCVQCCQLPLEWILKDILPRLERIEEICVATSSADDVRRTIENARKEFRQLAQQCHPLADSMKPCPDALVKLAEHPEMGPNHEGLLRILYHIEREVTRYQPDITKGKALRPTSLRVPASSPTMLESILLWISFLLTKFGTNAPVLILMPLRKSWMDIILGTPTDSQLYCLRASLEAIPLTSSVPYNMDSEFINRTNQLIEDSQGDDMGPSFTETA